MDAHERKVELFKRGVKAAAIARELGLSSQHVSLVINGRTTSARVQEAVARRLELPVEAVFPVRPLEGAAA